MAQSLFVCFLRKYWGFNGIFIDTNDPKCKKKNVESIGIFFNPNKVHFLTYFGFHKYPSIFVFQFCSNILYFLC